MPHPSHPKTLPTHTPFSGHLRQMMARYHQQIGAHVDSTVSDLHARWQAPRASLARTAARFEQQMRAAQASDVTTDVAWLQQAKRLAELKASVQGDVAAFAQGARQIVGSGQVGAISQGQQAAQEALAASVPPGMNYTFGVPPAAVTHQLAGALQDGSPLHSLFQQLGPDAAKQVEGALFTSLALGEGPRVAAQRLMWSADLSAQRAEVIARTELLRSWRSAQLENYRANSDVVSQWMWAADFGPRCCGACIAMDGTYHSLDTELDDHICGRCSALPITRSWAEILGDAGVDASGLNLTETSLDSWDSYLYGKGTASDWFARQEPVIQNQILGPAKAEAYRAGDLALKDLVGVRQSAEWGPSIQELSLKQLGMDAQSYLGDARAGGTAETLADHATLTDAMQGTPAHLATEAPLAMPPAWIDWARGQADEWYQGVAAAIDQAAAAGGSAEQVASAQAQADAWYAAIERSIASGERPPAMYEQLWDIRREEAIAVAEGRAEWLPQREMAAAEGEQAATSFGSVDEILARQNAVDDLYNVPLGDPTTMERENPEAAAVGAAEMDKMLGILAGELKDDKGFMKLARYFGYDSDQIAANMVTWENAVRAVEHGGDWVTDEDRAIAALTRVEAKDWAKEQTLKGSIYDMLERYHSAPASDGNITVWNADPFQVAVIEATAREFGITAAHNYFTTDQLAGALDEYGPYMKGLQAWLRQMHTDTQAWFSDQGITEVQIFRGLRWNEGTQPIGVDWNGGLTDNFITSQPIASWATHAEVAYDYASGTGMNFFDVETPDYSVVLVARVPVDQILSVGYTGLGSTPLRETMVMAGDYPIYAIPFAQTDAPGVDAIYQQMAGQQ